MTQRDTSWRGLTSREWWCDGEPGECDSRLYQRDAAVLYSFAEMTQHLIETDQTWPGWVWVETADGKHFCSSHLPEVQVQAFRAEHPA